MAVSRMKKVNIVGFAPYKDEVLKIIQDKEILQINIVDSTPELYKTIETKKEELDSEIKNLEFAIDFLANFEKKKKGMFAALAPDIIKKEQFEKITSEIDVKKASLIVQNVYKRQNEIKSEIQRLELEIINLTQWEALDLPINELGEWGETTRFIVKIVPQFFDAIVEDLKSNIPLHYEIVKRDSYYVYLLVVAFNKKIDLAYDILKKANYESVVLEDFNGTVKELINEIKTKVIDYKKELESLTKDVEDNVNQLDKLRIAYDYLTSEFAKEQAKDRVLNSNYTFLIEGWVTDKNLPVLEKALSSFKEIDISAREPLADEEPPTQYTNKPLASPYEMIVSMYSPPGYNEVDPSPLIMPFFTIFFAVCLTDAGYGLIIALFSLFMLKKVSKSKPGIRKLFKVILFSGLATVVIGLLTGGIFGIEEGLIKGTSLSKFRKSLMLFDPSTQQGMMLFFVLSLGLGWIHVFFGRIIAFIKQYRRDGLLAAIFDQMSWMIVMAGVLLLALTIIKPMFKISLEVPEIIGKIGLYLFLAGILIIFLFGGRSAKSIVGKLGSGLFEVYGISGLLGDILSYARLFALGLSTGVIAGVFNKLAIMLKEIGGVPGWIFFVIMLIVGHIFNIGMNALGSFIHTLRLQFVEFFGKFYEGGGEEFKPLKRELKYILVEKENIQ